MAGSKMENAPHLYNPAHVQYGAMYLVLSTGKDILKFI